MKRRSLERARAMLELVRRLDAEGGSMHVETAHNAQGLSALSDAIAEGLITNPGGWIDWHDLTARGRETIALNANLDGGTPAFPPTRLEKVLSSAAQIGDVLRGRLRAMVRPAHHG